MLPRAWVTIKRVYVNNNTTSPGGVVILLEKIMET